MAYSPTQKIEAIYFPETSDSAVRRYIREDYTSYSYRRQNLESKAI
jgi:hypothetical protein